MAVKKKNFYYKFNPTLYKIYIPPSSDKKRQGMVYIRYDISIKNIRLQTGNDVLATMFIKVGSIKRDKFIVNCIYRAHILGLSGLGSIAAHKERLKRHFGVWQNLHKLCKNTLNLQKSIWII